MQELTEFIKEMTTSSAPSTSDLPTALLYILDQLSTFDSHVLAAELAIDHQKLIGAIKSLQSFENLILAENITVKKIELSKEGDFIADNGSHEFNVYQSIKSEGATFDDLKAIPYSDVGIKKALQNGWIRLEKAEKGIRYFRKAEVVLDLIQTNLRAVRESGHEGLLTNMLLELKKRKLIVDSTFKMVRVTKGPKFQISIEKPETELTSEMLASGSWLKKTFKKLNFNALGVPPSTGHLHPLLKVRSEFRDIFFQMGFSEMPTNRYVESSFWNFDALFQPQQHPARDAQDTFFISDPALSTEFPEKYLAKVKSVHTNGGDYNSTGYQYDWDIAEAQKNVLRTHTTAVSARQLFKFAHLPGGFKPLKMFSIDRVFRNETLDATHLAEFHQVEGVIAEKNLSLGHVIGLFTEFFRKCGITNLRFKPTYNPYTEPSMEIFAYHDVLKKWVEIGNSGMFRPEMLLPMGFSEDVNIAGFGLSLERPTMIRYGISNIRELFGHKIDLQMVYENPILRLS